MENIYPEIVKEKSDEALLAMVYHHGQWEEDIIIEAEAELDRRNILPEEIRLRQNAITAEEDGRLSEGIQADGPGQVLGWIGIFGILGIIIGYHHAFAKIKAKYSGKTYFKYNEVSRENGRYTFYVSVAIVVMWVVYHLLNYIEDRI